ncbi:MAG TPA: ABC transporter permease [Solirubrobacteraceae bacterium]|jgi:peptide/nickel transport system permease protein
MIRFALWRIAATVAVLFAISVLTFLIFQVIPNGDPAVRLAGRLANTQEIHDVRRQWGFDKPIYVQYLRTMEQIFTGKVISYTQQVNVLEQIGQDLPATISLTVGAGLIWLVVGIALGLAGALLAEGGRLQRLLDRLLGALAMLGISMPSFLLGDVLLFYLGFKLHVFPLGGYVPLTQDPWAWLTHMILPWISLSILTIGFYSRLLRAGILDTLSEPYVRTARAKGLSERRVLIAHVLRNSLVPIVALWGLDFAAVLGGGALLTETVFNLGGVGQYAAESIQHLDIPPILVITMLTAFIVVLFSTITDVVQALLDPRVRLRS